VVGHLRDERVGLAPGRADGKVLDRPADVDHVERQAVGDGAGRIVDLEIADQHQPPFGRAGEPRRGAPQGRQRRAAAAGGEGCDGDPRRAAIEAGLGEDGGAIVDAEERQAIAGGRGADGAQRGVPGLRHPPRRTHAERRVHRDDGDPADGVLAADVGPRERRGEQRQRGDPQREQQQVAELARPAGLDRGAAQEADGGEGVRRRGVLLAQVEHHRQRHGQRREQEQRREEGQPHDPSIVWRGPANSPAARHRAASPSTRPGSPCRRR
jgi:hypothetical protein